MDGAASQPTAIEVEATVIRADGTVEELGTVARWHRDQESPNPLKRLIARRRAKGTVTQRGGR